MRVSYVDRISWILLCGHERYPMRGHSLVYKQKVGVVPRPAFTIYAIADVTLIANASKLIFTDWHTRCLRRTEIRIVSARGLWPTRETVTVVTLKAVKLRSFIFYIVNCVRERESRCYIILPKKYHFQSTFLFLFNYIKTFENNFIFALIWIFLHVRTQNGNFSKWKFLNFSI